MRDKSEYAILWANGMTFAEVYDLMAADIALDLLVKETEELGLYDEGASE